MKIAAIILLICAVSQAQEVKNIGYGSDFQLDCSDVVEDQNTTTTFEQWYDGSGNSLVWNAGGNDFKGSSWNADKMSVDFDAHTLSLNNAEFSDAGKYKCMRKGNEDYEKFFQVNVYGNPSTSAEATAQVVSGEDTLNVASCMITGTSKPYTIQWENENGEVVELPEASETVNADFAELVDVVLDLSLAVQSSSHNGAQYTCRVTHPLGTDSKDVSLIVTAGPTINNFSPSAQQTIDIGGSGNYECSAIGVPSAKVSWYGPNGEQITKDDETVSILEISDASYGKSGMYKCVATNDVDSTQQTFELIVQGSPEITSPADSGVTQVKAAENDKFVKVTCAAEAVPLPTITWSTPENTNATESVSDAISTLQIPVKAGQNAFSVNCTAANSKGSVERQFMITPPAATAGTAGMGMIIGILIAVLVLLAVIFFIVFRICTSRKQPVGDEECGEKDGDDEDADDSNQDLDGKAGCCAGLLKPKKATLVEEEDETKDINEVKETKEDGTADEKQKLTEAEETPAAETKDAECKDNGTTEHAEGENTENKEETAEGAEGESAEKSPKKKMKLSFPSSCFRKKDSKKDLQGQENDPEKVVEDEVNETEEQLTKESAPSSPQKVKEDDQDSGKGDTLDKGLEAPPAEEVEAK